MTDIHTTNEQGRAVIDRALLRTVAPPVVLVVLMWIVEIIDAIVPAQLDLLGIRAWDLTHLQGILLSPLLHIGWGHLVANTLPFLVFGCVIAFEGARRFWAVTGVVTLTSGLGAWLLAFPGTVTVGASGLVFGYFAYLVIRMWYVRSVMRKILYGAIGFVLIVVYGASMVFGMLPMQSGISWQCHVFGFLGGILAAWLLRDKHPATEPIG